MKSYTDQFDENDGVPKQNKAKKVASRRGAKREIQSLIREDEDMALESFNEYVEFEAHEYDEELYETNHCKSMPLFGDVIVMTNK